MIFDAENLFSDDQAVTTGTQISTNVIDLGVPGTPGAPNSNQLAQDLAKGQEIPINIAVTAAFVSGTSLLTEVIIADNAALTTNPVVVGTTGVQAEADLTLGKKFQILAIATGGISRFMGLRFTTVGTHTLGTIHSGIVAALQTNE